MNTLGLSLVVVACSVLVGFAAYVRLAPSDPAVWHVDPLTVSLPEKPNFDLRRPENGNHTDQLYPLEPAELMAAFDAVAQAQPRVSVLAGSAQEGHVTYIARSALWGFPDYISVRAIPAEGGARLATFSRARFGQSDIGVNRARMDAWLAQLRERLDS